MEFCFTTIESPTKLSVKVAECYIPFPNVSVLPVRPSYHLTDHGTVRSTSRRVGQCPMAKKAEQKAMHKYIQEALK